MPARCCDCCVFVGRVRRGDPGELICVNCPPALGEPVRVTPDGLCENFRPRRESPQRPTLPPPPNDKVRYIPLTRNLYTIVDAADFPELSKYKWNASATPGREYAQRREGNKIIYMHRQIMQPPPGKVTDHISGCRLDNRRENLRNCTHRENCWNSRAQDGASGFRGVSYDKQRRKYEAYIRVNCKKVTLGRYDDPVEAAHVRDRKAAEVYGPYAYINLPDDMEPRPIPPDPNHPERPVRMTGPYGYLHCPPYQPPLPGGTWPAGPRLHGLQRLLRRVAWALDHPTPSTPKANRPKRRKKCHPARECHPRDASVGGGEPESRASSTAEIPARPPAATESTLTKARRHEEEGYPNVA